MFDSLLSMLIHNKNRILIMDNLFYIENKVVTPHGEGFVLFTFERKTQLFRYCSFSRNKFIVILDD